MFFSVLPSLTFCSVSSMTEKNIYEQERILGLYFATYCMSLCSFSRETVLLTEEEQSLLNSFLVTDNNYVEYHGMVVDFHFTVWPINKRRLREDRCSKLSFFGYQMSTKALHHSASSTWLEEKCERNSSGLRWSCGVHSAITMISKEDSSWRKSN